MTWNMTIYNKNNFGHKRDIYSERMSTWKTSLHQKLKQKITEPLNRLKESELEYVGATMIITVKFPCNDVKEKEMTQELKRFCAEHENLSWSFEHTESQYIIEFSFPI